MRITARSLIGSAAALTAAILLAAGWSLAQYPTPLQMCRLPDGTTLRLEAVTLGPPHRLVLGRYWQQLLAALLPPGLQQRSGASILTYRSASPPALVFWTSRRGARFSSLEWAPAAVLAADGSLLGPLDRPFQTDLADGERVRGWIVPAFPRRAKTISLRIATWDRAGHRIPVATFTVPNPAPGPYPVWAGAPLPITRQEGDLAMTLTNLSTGLQQPGWLPPRTWAMPWTRAAFRITQNGKPVDDWKPVGLTLTDATGNVVVPLGITHHPGRGTMQRAFFGCPLPAEETWKLRTELVRAAGFVPADLWTVPGLSLPRSRTTAAVTRFGTKLRLIARLYGKTAPDRLRLAVEMPSPVNGVRLALLRATDERGRVTRPEGEEALQFFPSRQEAHDQRLEILDASGPRVEPEQWCEIWYPLRVFPDARKLDLTFVVLKSRYVEFLAKPARR